MATVNHIIYRPDGTTPYQGVHYWVRLMNQATKQPVEGFTATAGNLGIIEGDSDPSTGAIVLTLPANGTLNPPTTSYYEITFMIPDALPDVQTFQVPAGAGPFQLTAILYTP